MEIKNIVDHQRCAKLSESFRLVVKQTSNNPAMIKYTQAIVILQNTAKVIPERLHPSL